MDLGIGHARTMYMLYASRTPRLIQLVRKRLKLFFGLPKILWASLGKSLENFSSLNSSVCSFGRAAEVKYLRIRLHLTGVYKHGIPQKDSLQHTYFVQYHPRLFSVSFSLRSWFPWVTCISSIIEAFYPTPRSAFSDLLQFPLVHKHAENWVGWHAKMSRGWATIHKSSLCAVIQAPSMNIKPINIAILQQNITRSQCIHQFCSLPRLWLPSL